MIFKHAVPILYSSNVARSLAYYTGVLGFDRSWEWGSPPDFGGVVKDSVEIFFCENGQGNRGTWFSVFVDDVDAFYESAKAKGAKILSAPQTMEWGVREMLVEDPDGHKIRFGQGSNVSDRKRNEESLPQSVRIVARIPGSKERHALAVAEGEESFEKEAPEEKPLSAVVHAVVAEDAVSGKIIGNAFLLGNNNGFYYVKDVLVHPDWRGKRIGSAMMQALTDWLENNAPDNAYIALHTPENLEGFYRQFGFAPAFGMYRLIKRK